MSKMSYYHKPRSNPLDNRTLHELLDHNAEQHPDKESVVFYDENKKRFSMTFEQFKNQSIYLAASLSNLGLRRGERALLYGPNSLEYAVCWLALSRLGVNAVLISSGDVEREEVELLKRLKCSAMMCGLNLPVLQKKRIVNEIAELAESKTAEGEPHAKVIVTIGGKLTNNIFQTLVHSYDDLIEQGKSMDNPGLFISRIKVSSEDPCFVSFTSGSTGKAKAVAFTHHAIVNAVNLSVPGASFDGDTRSFSGWPMSWGCGAPVLVAAIVIGFTYITTDYTQLTMDDSYDFMLQIIQKEKCGGCSIPQQHVANMIAENFQDKYDFSNVKAFGFGSQIMPRKAASSILDVFPSKRGILVYALTEANTVGIQPLSKVSVGREDYGKMYILPDIEVQVVDEEGHVVPLGTKGEICVRGLKVFLEYLEDPESTSEAKSSNGWVHTSDYGIMFDRARIKVLGRKTDIIVKENQEIFPVEVEEILTEHPDVESAVAIGVQDGNANEEVCACVKEVPGSNLKARIDELKKWCKDQYPVSADGFSLMPKYFFFLKEFPISNAAKIDRRAIKRIAPGELGHYTR